MRGSLPPRRPELPPAVHRRGSDPQILRAARAGGPPLPSVRQVRLSSRRSDDADVIRARLRALLEETNRARGWLPDDDLVARAGGG